MITKRKDLKNGFLCSVMGYHSNNDDVSIAGSDSKKFTEFLSQALSIQQSHSQREDLVRVVCYLVKIGRAGQDYSYCFEASFEARTHPFNTEKIGNIKYHETFVLEEPNPSLSELTENFTHRLLRGLKVEYPDCEYKAFLGDKGHITFVNIGMHSLRRYAICDSGFLARLGREVSILEQMAA